MSSKMKTETMVLNMGPQHPATHGVLRIILTLDGETVVDAKPVIGYLHRGMEKIAENKTYNQFVTWTDKLDYLAALSNNIGYALAVEKLMGVQIPPKGQYLRVIGCELARIASHMVWLACNALDIGAATVFFYAFQEREYFYNLQEMLTGARMNVAYTRIGGHANEIPENFEKELRKCMKSSLECIERSENLLERNRIWIDRTKGVSPISAEDALNLSMTGPNLRAAGVPYDVRKYSPYLVYDKLNFEVPTGKTGDCYDRYLVRMEEMKQSIKILEQALEGMPEGPINIDNPKIFFPDKKDVYTKMEELIDHFMVVTDSIKPEGETYFSIESSKGELGFYIVGDGEIRPYRMHVRSPSFVNLQAIPKLCNGGMISDVIAVIASLDPVLGEVDR